MYKSQIFSENGTTRSFPRMLQFHCRLNLVCVLSICGQLVILASPSKEFPMLACGCFDWIASVIWINNSSKGLAIALCR